MGGKKSATRKSLSPLAKLSYAGLGLGARNL